MRLGVVSPYSAKSVVLSSTTLSAVTGLNAEAESDKLRASQWSGTSESVQTLRAAGRWEHELLLRFAFAL